MISRVIQYTFLALACLVFLLPVYLVVITALKDPSTISLSNTWIPPVSLYWHSFVEAWEAFAPKMVNSFVITISATLLSAIIGSINGYILAKWHFPGSYIIFSLMLFGIFIPYQAVLIPVARFISDIGIGGTLGVIMVHVVYGIPITTLIFRNFYAEIPDELMEAAAIDGAGFWAAYIKVLFPLSLPALVVVCIWQFTQIWNEFLFAVTLISSPTSQPVTVALAQLAGGEAVKWNLPMAGALLAALPTLLVYIFLGRYFVRGLLAGSVKG